MMKMTSNVEKREKKTYSLQKRKGKGGTEDDDMVSGCNLQGNTLQLQETLDGYFGFLRQNNKVS